MQELLPWKLESIEARLPESVAERVRVRRFAVGKVLAQQGFAFVLLLLLPLLLPRLQYLLLLTWWLRRSMLVMPGVTVLQLPQSDALMQAAGCCCRH